MPSGAKRGIERLLRAMGHVEDAILIVMLTIMIGFAVTQILLRNLFDSGIEWAEPLLRILVLWVGLAGAMVASRLDQHISINLLSRYLPARWLPLARALVHLFTTVVCAIVAWHAARFTLSERDAGTLAFAGVPSWIATLIIPVAFGAIGSRFLLLAVKDLQTPRAGSARE